MKLQELRNLGKKILIQNNVIDSAQKADILLEYVLNKTKVELTISALQEIENKEQKRFLEYINEISLGKPLQYITRTQEFMGMSFYVDENVLIPQPDTEILVEESIEVIKELYANKSNIKILDLCTGSGAIIVSIEKILNNKNIEFFATDISNNALKIAKKNAISNNTNTKIKFILSDMFNNIENEFDLIISNPPYIESKEILNLPKEVQNEPLLALDGGEDGLNYYRIIAKDAKKYLKEHGVLLLEIGYKQRESVEEILEKNDYKNITCIKDLAGNNRVIKGYI